MVVGDYLVIEGGFGLEPKMKVMVYVVFRWLSACEFKVYFGNSASKLNLFVGKE